MTTPRSTTACCRRCAEPGDHPLARRHVRSGARAVTGAPRTSTRRWISRSTSSTPTRRRSTASRSRCSTRSARSTCAGGSPQGVQDVYRRRFQLRRTDRRRRAGLSRTRCSAFSMRSRPRRPMRCRGWRAASARSSTTCWGRQCRCRATSSRRRPASTRPASCSWPISTAIRIISPWSAGRRARARPCIWPSCFALADQAGLLANPELATRRMKAVLALRGVEA